MPEDPFKLYRTAGSLYIEQAGNIYRVPEGNWDALLAREDLHGYLRGVACDLNLSDELLHRRLLAPIGSQEIWAAGVTYYRSRDARMAESKGAGGGDFYDRVYSAQRPELFFKGSAARVAGPGEPVRIRADATWSVPEPELTLVVNPHRRIIGYSIGNDMSSRDIEGENPLYLPQAKVYYRSSALGPCVLVQPHPLPLTTEIRMEIEREGTVEFSGATSLAALKRTPQELVDYLFREDRFPNGVYLMTGTGIVPPDSFSLRAADRIRITINEIGVLENSVASAG
jgi:2-dehydro-3-deoxy-D-arabinonate dehydratase